MIDYNTKMTLTLLICSAPFFLFVFFVIVESLKGRNKRTENLKLVATGKNGRITKSQNFRKRNPDIFDPKSKLNRKSRRFF